MNKSTSHGGNKVSAIFCQLFGHHYVVSKKVTKHIKEYRCANCQKQVTTDPNGKLASLTDKMREINLALHDMYQRRNRRLAHRHQPIKRVA